MNKQIILVILLFVTTIISKAQETKSLGIEGCENAGSICNIYGSWNDAGIFYKNNEKYKPQIYRMINLKSYAEIKGYTNWNTAIDNLLSDQTVFSTDLGEKKITLIYLPAGIYNFDRTINITKSNILIKGDGFDRTKLVFKVNTVSVGISVWQYRYDYLAITNKTNVGFEDFEVTTSVEYPNGLGEGSKYAFKFSGCTNSYIRSVKSYMAASCHVALYNSQNCEVRDSWFEESVNCADGGNGYGIVLGSQTSGCKIENNLFSWLRHAMILAERCNVNVIAYNYSRERRNDEIGGIRLADICFHGHSSSTQNLGPIANLIEGNIANFLNFDCYWGENGINNYVISNILSDEVRIEDPLYNLNEYDCDEEQQKDQYFYFNWAGDESFQYTPSAAVNNWEYEESDFFTNYNENIKTRSLIYSNSYGYNINRPLWWYEEMDQSTFPFNALDRKALTPAKKRFNDGVYIKKQGFLANNITMKDVELKYEKMSGEYFAESFNIGATCSVKNGNSTLIKANKKIVFKPGFKAEQGSNLKTQI